MKLSLTKTTKQNEQYEQKYGVWHRWFAWHPMPVSSSDGSTCLVWLRKVGRKLVFKEHYKGRVAFKKYCLEEDIVLNSLKDNKIERRSKY